MCGTVKQKRIIASVLILLGRIAVYLGLCRCGLLLKPNSITLAGSKLVRSWSPTSFEPDSVMEFGFEPVCDQLRTSFEPVSVVEFGFYRGGLSVCHDCKNG